MAERRPKMDWDRLNREKRKWKWKRNPQTQSDAHVCIVCGDYAGPGSEKCVVCRGEIRRYPRMQREARARYDRHVRLLMEIATESDRERRADIAREFLDLLALPAVHTVRVSDWIDILVRTKSPERRRVVADDVERRIRDRLASAAEREERFE